MERVKLKCLSKPANFLQYVKLVKEHAGMDLRSAKDFCDNSIKYLGVDFELYITTSSKKFDDDISSLIGSSIQVYNHQKERQRKLISLGLGDKSDLIDLLADDMASELVFKVKSANQSGLYGIFNDYISDILINFTSEQLDKLLNNKLIKEKE
jgi:hypothetical protein